MIIIQWKIQNKQDKKMFTGLRRHKGSSSYIKCTTQVEETYTNVLRVYGQKRYQGLRLQHGSEIYHLNFTKCEIPKLESYAGHVTSDCEKMEFLQNLMRKQTPYNATT
jgi:hypothetical protein